METFLNHNNILLIMAIVNENKIKINVGKVQNKISKKMEIFYNPTMKFNRDSSIILLNSLQKKKMIIGMPLSGSGIRGLRFLKELKKGIINEIYFNDYKEDFELILKKSLRLNKIKKDNNKIIISKKDANLFILENNGFSYIEVDPFGSPNPFLDSAVRRISREGVLAITATDTSALAGTYPKACARKYFAKPLRNYLMHEIGLRILIRKIQLIGAQYEKALVPIFSYSKDHYYRIFFRSEKGKKKVDEVLKQHQYFLIDKKLKFEASKFNSKEKESLKERKEYAGPLWIGKLFDDKLIRNMKKEKYTKVIGIENKEDVKFFEMLCEETKVDILGFYDIPEIMKRYKIKDGIKLDKLTEKLKKNKFKVARTHLSKQGIKTDASIGDVVKVMN